jgi:hypothetical protein
MFIPQLANDNNFFHSAFVNPCMMLNQRRSQSGVRLTVHLPIEHNRQLLFEVAPLR